MTDSWILAHDIGTSGIKTSIVDSGGSILDSASFGYETRVARPSWSEQNPDDWWQGVCRNTKALVERHSDLPGRVAGIGLSGHMLGCLPVDGDGKPLAPSMLHSDFRAGKQARAIDAAVGARTIYEMTGNILDPRSSLCKALWLRDERPDLYKNTHRFLQSKDYVVACLTGNPDTSDYSDASHGQFLDVSKMEYGSDVLREIGLDLKKLPTLRRGTDVAGTLCKSAADQMGLPEGVPVVAGAGDGACAGVGAGVVVPGDIYCCLGSTAWISGISGKAFIDEKNRLFNIVSPDGENCGVFGTVQCAGGSLQYAMKLFEQQDFAAFEKQVMEIDPGSDGLIFLPYLEGERSPIWDADARGVYFGISPTHRRAHYLRATIEGVGFALRSVLDVFREKADYPSMRLIGGGAQSPAWREVLTHACRATLQILSVRPEDATSLGAAITAGVGVGIFKNLHEGVRSIQVAQESKQDVGLCERYEALYGVYKKLYPGLKDAFALSAQVMDNISK
ncbi:MAG: xylulokinase [Candidatus Sumerlaeia bacterium]